MLQIKNQHANKKEQENPRVYKDWSKEDLNHLLQLMKKFPPGTFERLEWMHEGFKGKFDAEEIADWMKEMRNLQV